MPSETVDVDCVTAKEVSRAVFTEVGARKSHNKQHIKEEQEVETARTENSMLYALAAAAASRSSPPNFTVKQEAPSPSPEESLRKSDSSMPMIKTERTPSPESDSSQHDGASVYANCQKKDHEGPTTSNEHFREHDADGLPMSHAAFMAPSQDINNAVAKHANQLHLMEAMMHRQRQLYDEYGQNSWMKLQRNDSSCLSKSKAKRYRWCVQKQQDDEKIHDSVMTQGTQSTVDYSPSLNKKKLPTSMKRSANPMQDKLYGTVFTGASKFRCRDCGNSFGTLVDLTVHMSKTGHYRDQNLPEMKGRCEKNKFAKPKKRSMMEIEEKESAEKVLKCLGCGHSFDSLQDLTVHMIKTKHYEDVPSLRLYSQRNDFCATAGGISQVPGDEKSNSTASQRAGNNVTSVPEPLDGIKYPNNSHDNSAMNFLAPGVAPPSFGGHTNFANMLSMAALRLLGFPPYFMQMPFPGAMNGYDMANAAYAAAAARFFLSSPWLSQMPGLNAGAMYPPFFTPHTPLPPGVLPHSRQPSPVAGEIPGHATPTRSVASSMKSANRSSSSESHTPNGIGGYREDLLSSKSHILRCVQCGESFTSLQKMTDHMRETTHFPIAMTPPVDESNHRRGSRCSSASESPHSKSSPPRSAATPTSSPLEQLAKLACGKSFGEMNHTSFARSKPNGTETVAKINVSPGSTASPSRETKKHIPLNHSIPDKSYICPDSPRTDSASLGTGFDFIKSLETTIQSAISRVNQPARTPILERQLQPSHTDETRPPKSRKHRILSSFLPNAARQHRKSFPDNLHCSGLPRKHEKEKPLNKRPASDGEEYYRKETSQVNDKAEVHESGKGKRTHYSPPLDLSKTLNGGADIRDGKFSSDKKKIASVPQVGKNKREENTPTQSIQRNNGSMKTLVDSNARKRWEKKGHPHLNNPTQLHDQKRHRGDDNELVSSQKTTRKLSTSASEEYTIDKEKTNPLKEMQKIINATELSLHESRNAFSTSRNCRKRAIDAETAKQERPTKTYKPSSVLSDLVRHDDDSPPAIDPLAQMEHLVNLQIGTKLSSDKLSSSMHSRKPNLAKPYSPIRPEPITAPRNGNNPMSALMSLFSYSGNESLTNSHRIKENGRSLQSVEHESNCPKLGKQHHKPKASVDVHEQSNGDISETARLREKMAEFFRSMIAQGQPLPSKNHTTKQNSSNHTTVTSYCTNLDALSPSQEVKLQKLFTSHFKDSAKSVDIPEGDLDAVSTEISLSTDGIKEWISNTKKQLMEKGQCSFIHLSQSDASLMFRCTSCSASSAQGLSAQDFLHHLSTHISDKSITESPKRRNSREDSNLRKKDWEMLYRGAMRFRSLKANDVPSTYSLTATVAESPVASEFSSSPTIDVVAGKRKHVEVIDDSPIKVSG